MEAGEKLSYLFFVLVYAHLLLMLLPPALAGGVAAQMSVAVYSLIFVAYIVLRIRRELVDRKAEEIAQDAVAAG